MSSMGFFLINKELRPKITVNEKIFIPLDQWFLLFTSEGLIKFLYCVYQYTVYGC